MTPYLPGVPRIRPVELITEAVIEYLQKGHAAGLFVQDAGDPSLKRLTVVDTERR